MPNRIPSWILLFNIYIVLLFNLITARNESDEETIRALQLNIFLQPLRSSSSSRSLTTYQRSTLLSFSSSRKWHCRSLTKRPCRSPRSCCLITICKIHCSILWNINIDCRWGENNFVFNMRGVFIDSDQWLCKPG